MYLHFLDTFEKIFTDLYSRLKRPWSPQPSHTPGPLQKRPSGKLWIPVALLLLIAAGALAGRLYATRYTYTHPDEEIARAVVIKVLRTGDNDTNWLRTDVDPFFRYDEYNFSSYYLFCASVERILGHSAWDIKHPAFGLKVHLRELSTVLGGLCVLFAGILGWRLDGRIAAFTTAILTACSVTLFQDSLYARPETFVTLLTLFLMLVLTSKETHRGLVLTVAGLLVGLLIACKVTFLIYLPFPLLIAPALLSTPKDGNPSAPHLFLWSGSLCAYFLAIGLGFALGAPYALRYPWEYVEGLVPLLKQYENGASLNVLGNNLGLATRLNNSVSYLTYTVGYPALILALIGTVRLVWRRDMRALLLMGGPLLTLLYFMQTKTFYERNLSQSLPVLFILTGIGIRYLTNLIRNARKLRIAVCALLLCISAATPSIVLAKVFYALDGGYQQSVAAETESLSRGGTVGVYPLVGDIVKTALIDDRFCGPYILKSRYYNNQNLLDPLLSHGFHVVGQVTSIFGEDHISTLQTYLAPTMIYLAPPQPESCQLDLGPLIQQPAEAPLQAHVAIAGGWNTVSNKSNDAPKAWDWQIYDSWDGADSNTGTLTIGPFQACGDIVIPYDSGPSHIDTAVSIRIIRHTAHGDLILYEGLPSASDDKTWSQITIHQPAGTCGTYTITGTDRGTGWGEWIGLGMPVSVSRPSPRQDGSSSR